MQEMQVQSLGQEDSPGEGNGNPLQYSCLGNSMGRGAWKFSFQIVALEQFSGSLSSRTPISCFVLHWLVCLSTLPLGVHAPISQDGSLSEGLLEEQDSSWSGIILWLLTPQESVCSLPHPKRGVWDGGDSLILYSDRVLSLFVLAMITSLRGLQETKTGYLFCFCCYFHFRGQAEGWL